MHPCLVTGGYGRRFVVLPPRFAGRVVHQAPIHTQDSIAWCSPHHRNRRDPLWELAFQVGEESRQGHATGHAGCNFVEKIALKTFEEPQLWLMGHWPMPGEYVH